MKIWRKFQVDWTIGSKVIDDRRLQKSKENNDFCVTCI